MATYINTETNEYPVCIGDILLAYPSATEENLPSNFEVVEDTPYPECAENEIVNVTGAEKVDGVWKRVFLVRPMTDEEIKSRAIAKAMIEADIAKERSRIQGLDVSGSAPNVSG